MTSFLSGGRGSVFDVLACQSLDLGSTPDGSLSFSFSSACVISTSYKFFEAFLTLFITPVHAAIETVRRL